jgi:hypothetical protein
VSLKYGKAEIKLIAEALEQQHDSAEAAALAALQVMEGIFEKRAKFVVVGQLMQEKGGSTIDPTDPRAIKVSLGWYSTEGEALTAASSLWTSTASGDTYRCWVLPVHHGTPSSLHSKRKAEIAAQAEKAKDKASEKIRADIEKRQREEAERAAA